MKILEPTPERRRHLQEQGITPRTLLQRWAYLGYALAKFLLGALVVSMGWILLIGGVIELGLLTGDAAAILGILGFIPLGKLFYAWGFPIRY